MEYGFYHPDRGYWQVTGEPPQRILDGYPEGTVEVPVKPGSYYEWSGSKWVKVAPPPPLPEDVNAERDRRLRAGVSVTVDGRSIPVQGRSEDQINLLALDATARDLIDAGIIGAVIPFRDAANALHSLTSEQVRELARQGKAAASAIYQTAWDMKDGTGGFTDGIPADFADDKHWP